MGFIVYILAFGIVLFILFFLMKAAVQSALDDERHESAKKSLHQNIDKEDFDNLIALRDMELLSNSDLEELIAIYKKGKVSTDAREQYSKYSKVLNDLVEKEYLNQEQYNDKIDLLKIHYNIG